MLKGQKTTLARKETAASRWWLVDLEGKTLGRVATRIADLIRGKTKPSFTPHVDMGDFVVAINAEKIHLTGKKWEGKKYYSHTGYFGGIREKTAAALHEKHPEALLTKAVKGMLPRNDLSRQILKKLKVYAGKDHPHTAQNPTQLEIA